MSDSAAHAAQPDDERGWDQVRLLHTFSEEVRNAVRAAYPTATMTLQEFVEEASREESEVMRGVLWSRCFPDLIKKREEFKCLLESFLAHMDSSSAPEESSEQPSKCPISADLLDHYNKPKGQGNALDEFRKHIAKFSPDRHRRVYPICQSSGVGKSRMCVELGKTHALVYLPLAVQDERDSAVPATMQAFSKAIKAAGKHKDAGKRQSTREHAVKLLLSSVCRAVDRYCTNNDSLAPDPKELWEAQFTGEYRFYKELHTAWGELCQTHPLNNINSSPADYKNRDSKTRSVSFNVDQQSESTSARVHLHFDTAGDTNRHVPSTLAETPSKQISGFTSSSSSSSSTSSSSMLSSFSSPSYELYIVIDEIAVLSLGEDPHDPSSPIRCLYRIVDNSREGIRLITLSTTSWYSQVMPGHVHSTRQAPRQDSPVFFDLIFQDLFDSKKGSVFGKGRPLWAKHRERAAQLVIGSSSSSSSSPSPWLSTIALAQNLLLGKNRGSSTQSTNLFSLFALAFSRLPIAVFGQDVDELVAHHLAMLVGWGANVESPRLMCRYLSEPIIAETAACTMNGVWLLSGEVETHSSRFSAKAVVDGLQNLETSSMLVSTSTGDRGEVTGALSLLFILDALRAEKMKRNHIQQTTSSSIAWYNPQDNREGSFSSDVSAIDFIKALCSAEQLKDPALLEWLEENLKDYVVSCTHFMKPTDKESIGENIIKDLYNRCAGIYLPTNFYCSDLVIIMRKKFRNGFQYAVILISMKNYEKKIAKASVEKFMEHLRPDILEYTDFVHEKPFVSIVFNTGGVSFEKDAIVPHHKKIEKSGLFLSADLKNNFAKLPPDLRKSLWCYSACLRRFKPLERYEHGAVSLRFASQRATSLSLKAKQVKREREIEDDEEEISERPTKKNKKA